MPELTLDDRHRYFYGGHRVVSVTQMLSALGLTDYSAPWFTDDARDKGSYLHRCCELIDENDLDMDSVDPAMRAEVEAYAEWKETVFYKPAFTEKPLYSEVYCFAGTPDTFGTLGSGRYAVIDRKRGAAGAAVAYQLASYSILIAEHHSIASEWNIARFSLGNLKARPKMIEHRSKTDLEAAKAIAAVYHDAFNKGIYKLD